MRRSASRLLWWSRDRTRAQQGDKAGALADIDWILEKMPEGVDLAAVRDLRRRIERSR